MAVLLLVTLTACGSDGSDASDEVAAEAVDGDATVVLKDMQFQPDVITVDAGTTVTWVWDDGSVRHNVVADQFGERDPDEGHVHAHLRRVGRIPVRLHAAPQHGGDRDRARRLLISGHALHGRRR